MQIRCDKCEKLIQVEGPVLGSKVACPACGDINIIRADDLTAGVAAAQPIPGGAQAVRQDRAAAAGLPPALGPEVVVMSIRPAMFRARPLLFLLLFVLMLGGLVGVIALWGTGNPVLPALSGAVALAAGVALLVWRIRKLGEGLRITSKRIIDREGFFSKVTSEVLHADIKNVQVRQTFTDRIFGVGTIAISSSAENEDEISMKDVPNPDRVRSTIDLYRPL